MSSTPINQASPNASSSHSYSTPNPPPFFNSNPWDWIFNNARTFYEQGFYGRTLLWLNHAHMHPEQKMTNLIMQSIYADPDQRAAALAELNEVQKHIPFGSYENINLLHTRACLYNANNDGLNALFDQEHLREVERVIALRFQGVHRLIDEGHAFYNAKKRDEALAKYNEYISQILGPTSLDQFNYYLEKFPEDAAIIEVIFCRGLIHYNQGSLDQAIADFEVCIGVLEPLKGDLPFDLIELKARALMPLTVCYLDQENGERAIATLSKCIETESYHPHIAMTKEEMLEHREEMAVRLSIAQLSSNLETHLNDRSTRFERMKCYLKLKEEGLAYVDWTTLKMMDYSLDLIEYDAFFDANEIRILNDRFPHLVYPNEIIKEIIAFTYYSSVELDLDQALTTLDRIPGLLQASKKSQSEIQYEPSTLLVMTANRMILLNSQRKLTEAFKVATTYLENNARLQIPSFTTAARVIRGIIHANQHDYDLAIKDLEIAHAIYTEKKNPRQSDDHITIVTLLSICYSNTGLHSRTKKRLDLFAQGLQLYPNSVELSIHYAYFLHGLGSEQEALDILSNHLEQTFSEKKRDVLTSRIKDLNEKSCSKKKTHRLIDEVNGLLAAKKCGEALQLMDGHLMDYPAGALFLSQKGAIFNYMSKDQEATEVFTFLREELHHSNAFASRGEVHSKQQHYAPALVDYQSYMECYPGESTSYLRPAALYCETDKFEEAKCVLLQGLKVIPQSKDLIEKLLDVYFLQHKPDDVLTTIEQFLKENPETLKMFLIKRARANLALKIFATSLADINQFLAYPGNKNNTKALQIKKLCEEEIVSDRNAKTAALLKLSDQTASLKRKQRELREKRTKK